MYFCSIIPIIVYFVPGKTPCCCSVSPSIKFLHNTTQARTSSLGALADAAPLYGGWLERRSGFSHHFQRYWAVTTWVV